MAENKRVEPPTDGTNQGTTRRAILKVAGSTGVYAYFLHLIPTADGRTARIHGPAIRLEESPDNVSTIGDWNQTSKLTSSDTNSREFFGSGVSLDGSRALIGAPGDSEKAPDAGAAYMFEFGGSRWNQTQKLTANDADSDDSFGENTSLDGTRALISARLDSEKAPYGGAAYIFDFDGSRWRQTQKLAPAEANGNEFFGSGIALDGDRALIGASGSSERGRDSGAAYIFDFDGSRWRQTQKLTPANTDDKFGIATSLDGSRAIIGAIGDSGDAKHQGAVYVFESDGSRWRQTQKLTHADADYRDRFGRGVSLDGDRALIWIVGGSEEDSDAVSVFDFDGSRWNQTQKLTPADAEEGELFGSGLALDGDRALIGARGDSEAGINGGVAHVFEFEESRWRQTQKLYPNDPDDGDLFGVEVSLDGRVALIGASGDSEAAENAGAAYVFEEVVQDTPSQTRTTTTNGDDGDDGDDGDITLAEIMGVGLAGTVVGFLIGNPGDEEIKKKALGILVVVFGGGGIIGLVQQSATIGWLVAISAVGVILGLAVGAILLKLGFSFAP